jgi:hypothetical protein
MQLECNKLQESITCGPQLMPMYDMISFAKADFICNKWASRPMEHIS